LAKGSDADGYRMAPSARNSSLFNANLRFLETIGPAPSLDCSSYWEGINKTFALTGAKQDSRRVASSKDGEGVLGMTAHPTAGTNATPTLV